MVIRVSIHRISLNSCSALTDASYPSPADSRSLVIRALSLFCFPVKTTQFPVSFSDKVSSVLVETLVL